ncbi:type II toxin-antitoxin system RelE/ParE family toxin [Azospirillum sp. TSO22-1]|uniref:type II toxin-antitoxin system RelE/ParE family toxin n=1 Tax=Azospirillum sp. TSO22-1 TaxID=716789 RepID=UPI000D61C6A6|nr:type II toxin-antitoxin system RelE/ParE family toxin [Azospirillum sp. TSO22-1]PWC53770.1 hypothetical protein TSO221_09995 [Azospirillum sp. TSO22-1]
MPRVVFAKRAQIDLAEIADYIGKDNPRAARRLVLDLRDTCPLIAGHPAMGRNQGRLLPSLRSHTHGSYVVFYRPINGGIEVVRVLHGARDIDAAFPE